MSIALILLGLIFLWLTKKQTAGKLCITFAVLLLIGFGMRPVSIFINRPLEQTYPPFSNAQPVDFIIVLGHGHVSDPTIPLNSQLTEAATARITEAIRIKKLNPQAKLILSGSTMGDPISGAEMYARYAESFGISRTEMLLIKNAKDTEEEVRKDSQLVKGHPTALVTSATHMPRAMQLFIKEGIPVIPAPTQYVGRNSQIALPFYAYLPSGRYLMYSEMGLHEWIGQLWNRIRE